MKCELLALHNEAGAWVQVQRIAFLQWWKGGFRYDDILISGNFINSGYLAPFLIITTVDSEAKVLNYQFLVRSYCFLKK